MRSLARRTGEATHEIATLIEQIQADTTKSEASMHAVSVHVEDGVAQAKQALEAMEGIVRSSTR